MATFKVGVAVVTAVCFLLHSSPALGQTATSTTQPVPQAKQMFKNFVKEVPEFCKTNPEATEHCALAPLLYEAGQVWETRAIQEYVAKEECKRNLGACEKWRLENPEPVETDWDLGTTETIIIVVGAILAGAGIGIGVGFSIGKRAGYKLATEE